MASKCNCELDSATVSESILFWSVQSQSPISSTALLSMPHQLLGNFKITQGPCLVAKFKIYHIQKKYLACMEY